MMHLKNIKDKDISFVIGNILRWGVYLSLSVALLGGLVFLYHHGNEPAVYQHQEFVEKNENILDLLKATFGGVVAGHGYFMIELGVLLLIATPLARVIFSLVAFKLENDNLYVLITLIVLLVICLSVLTGFGG